MAAYYNEFEPYAAQWLRNLIAAGHIAPGDVDERSIKEVKPDDLRGYTQCHFFAGIGVWSYALRSAGWDDSRPIWTGSCPCQPFSAAGRGDGFADERHLWPHWFQLILQLRPPVVLGEQVASKDTGPWIDLVHADMEALGYAFGCVPFPAAGVGAPHIRDRNYWAAYADEQQRHRGGSAGSRGWSEFADSGGLGDHHHHPRLEGHTGDDCGSPGYREGATRPVAQTGVSGGVADNKLQQRSFTTIRRDDPRRWNEEPTAVAGFRSNMRPGPTNGFWRDADWLGCRDGKWRPVEPGSQPLAHGAFARVGRLCAYGNAIVAPQAQVFIESVMDCLP